MKTLHTTRAVIEALGDSDGLAKSIEATRQTVSNWRVKGFFPAGTYLQIKALLLSNNLDAPDELWAMRPNRRRKKK